MRRHSGRLLGPICTGVRPGGQQPLHEDADDDNDNKRQSHRLEQHAPQGRREHLRKRFDECVNHRGTGNSGRNVRQARRLGYRRKRVVFGRHEEDILGRRLICPGDGLVVKAVHEGGFHDLEIRRDVEVARRVKG